MRYQNYGSGMQIDRGLGWQAIAPAPALGNCFTGTCANALAPYGWPQAPCNQQPPMAGPDGGMGNCFTGSCANALAPYGWPSPACGAPPAIQVVEAVVAVMIPRASRAFLARR